MGSDGHLIDNGDVNEISIHAPRMGSDFPSRWFLQTFHVFQSTLPGWGATGYVLKHRKSKRFQSTLPGW